MLRHEHAAIEALLDGGLPPDVKNERRWNPVDEAVALGDAAATKLLYTWACRWACSQLGPEHKGCRGLLVWAGRQARVREDAEVRACPAPPQTTGASSNKSNTVAAPPRPCSRLLAAAKVAKRQKKAQLVAIMEQLPDFRMQAGQPRLWAGLGWLGKVLLRA